MANEKAARTGMEMLIAPMLKSIGLDPEQLRLLMIDIGGKVSEFDNRMARMEKQNEEILRALAILLIAESEKEKPDE